MAERLFSTYQIAKLLGTTLSSVDQWIHSGSLGYCHMPDGTNRITESALIKFLSAQGIDLGEMLAKVTFAKTTANSETTEFLPQSVSTDDTLGEFFDPENETTHKKPINLDPPTAVNTPIEDESPEEVPTVQPAEAASANLRAEQVCDAILSDAIRQGAQTIHLTPHHNRLVLQLRTDGILRDKLNFDSHLPDDLRRQTIECLIQRATGEINLNVPNNTEFTQTIDGQDLALRLSSVPTACGPRLVIHMPRPAENLDMLALESSARAHLEEILQSDGLILVASKRRTGRDTTLRAMLNTAGTNARSVIAIEQNPSGNLDNVAQVQIDTASGLTFATATSELEYQDADTIVLTELRDPDTACNTFNTAHDGALVIAGLNADSAAGAINELLEMGIEPWPLGGTLKAIVEQTARRTLCEHCKQQSQDSSAYLPVGCDRCGQSGWSSRTIISNVIFIDEKLTRLIRTGNIQPDDLL
ncbi:MAG: Flp pilus assembly complex ATPase component [bacterium]|nr:Flp pilus assembly complex ATPase component [bacterium]